VVKTVLPIELGRVNNVVAARTFCPDCFPFIVLVFDEKPNAGDAFAASRADTECGTVRSHEFGHSYVGRGHGAVLVYSASIAWSQLVQR
jgi:hypothetical protein